MLADLGAEVIRVESPSQKGKPSLVVGQVALSRGKLSMTLDVRQPQANDVLKRLAPTMDVIVENARPGAMEARGFGYTHARSANPGIIWCAITGFGQAGPYAEYTGHDLSYLAHSGLLGAMSESQPWHPGVPLALQAGALSAVVAIQAALLQRLRSGDGGFVDISLSEAAGWFLSCGIRPFSDHPMMLPATPDRRLYACVDGRFVAVACAEPRTWAVLCEALGVPELKPNLHKVEAAQSTTHALAAIFATRAAQEWAALLAPLGAAVTVMNHAKQLLDDPHVRVRGSIAEVDGTPVPATPIRIASPDGTKTVTETAPPHTVGQDTETVLASAEFSREQIATLTEQGLI